MAIRNVDTNLWNDPKVTDDFTPEDKLFWVYCLTSPYGNLSGVFEISFTQLSKALGYSDETIKNLIYRFTVLHDRITYIEETKELFIHNWYKYNWTKSPLFEKSLMKFIDKIKDNNLKEYVLYMYKEYKEGDTVLIPYQYHTKSISKSISKNNIKKDKKLKESSNSTKKKYGEFKNVLISDTEYQKLIKNYYSVFNDFIEQLSRYLAASGKKYKSHYAVILNWISKANEKNINEVNKDEFKYIPRDDR